MVTSGAKRRIFVVFIAALILLLSFRISPKSVSGQTYSDPKMLEYANMEPDASEENVVPTLYKNDAVFGNHRRFPLVVYSGVPFVPVEMFSGLSGIHLTYGYSISYFYLANENGSRYISFDIENDAVTTHDKKTYTLETKVFYNTRYLPAEAVAKVLGLKIEIYDDPKESIYALRLSDTKAKISFSELIRMYSPIKKGENEDDNSGEKLPPVVDVPQTIPEIGRRNIYITVDTMNYAGITDTLSGLERRFGVISAVFFVYADDILDHPDEIRQIIAYGHNVGILLKEKDIYTEYENACENLRLVAKKKTRLVRLATGSTTKLLTDEDYNAFVEKYGVCVWDYNVNITDSRNVYDSLYNLYSNARAATAVLRLQHSTNTDNILTKIYEVASSKEQLRIYTIDETVKPVNYR